MGRKSRRKREVNRIQDTLQQSRREVYSEGRLPVRHGLLRTFPVNTNLLMACVLILLTMILYGHALNSPFLFDDVPNISRNIYYQFEHFSLATVKEALEKSPNSSRPISNFSFILNIFLHGNDAGSLRFVNFLIHCINGYLLFWVISRTLSLPVNRLRQVSVGEIAFWATLIWFTHPLHVQSVTYIVQRMNSLAALFYLATFVCYIKARLSERENVRWGLGTLAVILFLLGLGSKENAVMIPVFILLYEWFFFQDLSFGWLRKNVPAFIVILLILASTTIAYLGVRPFETIVSAYEYRDFTLWQRMMTEPRVILHYIDLLILPHPHRLSLLHEFKLSTSPVHPITTLPAFLILNGMVITAVVMARKFRLLSFCMLWFFGNLFLESSFVGLEILFEHRTYLPSMFFCLFLALLVITFVKSQYLQRSILVVMLVFFSFWTYQRNTLWTDEVSLWRDCLQKNPFDVRIYNNLGLAIQERGDTSVAMEHYYAALEIDPLNITSLNHLGIALARQGNFEAAIEKFESAIAISPEYAVSYYNLAIVFGDLGYFSDAIEYYNKAEKINKDHADPNLDNNLGVMLAKIGRKAEAIEHFKRSLQIRPVQTEAHNNLGSLYARDKLYEKAAGHFRDALKHKKDDPLLHNRLGLTLMMMGDFTRAQRHFKNAISIDPGFTLARQNLLRLQEKNIMKNTNI